MNPPPRRRRSALWTVLLLTLIAFLLRISNLGLESLDIDEADGTAFIANGLSDLIARLFRNGENGPLYYLLLHFWAMLAGAAEEALRYPSVLLGTLLVPLVYAVLRRLMGPAAGLLAALLVTCSAYLIHYAQMLKMYALVAALAALATYAFLRALEGGERRWWAAYVAAVSAAMYSHIFGVLLLLWHGAYVLLRWRELRQARRGWLAAVGLLSLPYLPLGLWHLDNVRKIDMLSRQFTGARTLPGMLAELAGEYGARVEDPPRAAVSFLFGSLALVGLAWLARHPERRFRLAGLFLGLGVLAPVGLVALLVVLGAPVYSPRYLIITLLSYLGLWTAGLRAAWSRAPALGLAGLGIVLAVNGGHLAQRDLGGVAFREDWRAALGYIQQRALPGDGVLILSSAAGNAYRYYGSPSAGLIDTEALRRQAGDDGLSEALDAATGGKVRRLWLAAAFYEFPDYPPVQGWLASRTQYEREVWFRNIRVALHAPSPDPSFDPVPVSEPLSLTFGDQLELVGMDRGPIPTEPGQPWQVRLVWRAAAAPAADYAVSLRVVDAAGTVWGRSEGPLGGAFRPTARWQPGQMVTDDRDVALAPGMPPGAYRVGVYVYRRDTVANLPVTPSDPASPHFGRLGALKLQRPQPVDPARLGVPLDLRFDGGLRLLGLEAPPGSVSPGEPATVSLVFGGAAPPPGARLDLTLTDAEGHRSTLSADPSGERDGALLGPTARRVALTIPLRFAAGPVRLELALYDSAGRPIRAQTGFWSSAASVRLTEFSVAARPVRTDLPEGLAGPARPLGDGVTLAGLGALPGAVKPGASIDVRLAWRADAEPKARWNATVQLFDSAGALAAQRDGRIGGGVPSDGWRRGEVTEDTLSVPLPPALAPGAYRMILALYDPEEGSRLRLESGGDALELGTINVVR